MLKYCLVSEIKPEQIVTNVQKSALTLTQENVGLLFMCLAIFY